MPRPNFIDLIGQRFAHWVVLHRADGGKAGQVRWLCRCDCGNEFVVRSHSLRRGLSTRCRSCASAVSAAFLATIAHRPSVCLPKAAPRCAARTDWDAIADDVLDLAEQGVSRREIARRYGLSKNAVIGWLNRNADLIGYHRQHRDLLLPLDDVPDHLREKKAAR